VVHVSLVRKILFNPNQLLPKLLQAMVGKNSVERKQVLPTNIKKKEHVLS
jgi:hypothetical protein